MLARFLLAPLRTLRLPPTSCPRPIPTSTRLKSTKSDIKTWIHPHITNIQESAPLAIHQRSALIILQDPSPSSSSLNGLNISILRPHLTWIHHLKYVCKFWILSFHSPPHAGVRSQELVEQGREIARLGFGGSPFPPPNMLIEAYDLTLAIAPSTQYLWKLSLSGIDYRVRSFGWCRN